MQFWVQIWIAFVVLLPLVDRFVVVVEILLLRMRLDGVVSVWVEMPRWMNAPKGELGMNVK